ncbi:hypothetical protein LCGC14_2875440 [marine sediment metagenome]|uniref:Uncharacterized protein n=1 Tax=marine sediment metagenome TaxID=412755 RepID=A0A0F9A9N5_9ZZZZ
MQTLQVEVAIAQEDIATCGKLKGFVNDAALMIGGAHYVSGSLIFRGFIGVRGEDRLFHGAYQFEVAEDDCIEDAKPTDFGMIPGVHKNPEAQSSCEVEVIHSGVDYKGNGDE